MQAVGDTGEQGKGFVRCLVASPAHSQEKTEGGRGAPTGKETSPVKGFLRRFRHGGGNHRGRA